jgi:asparagine synthase (glutamine-hydrolysing)
MKPGYYALYDKDGLHMHQYWDLIAKEHTDSYNKTVETVSFLVRDAIQRQMVSDVPVCSFLSGGIDSSIVTAVACKTFNSPADFNTFSFDFAGNDRYFQSNRFQPERDNKYVEIMLQAYHTHHTYLQCDEKELVALLREATYAKDLPGMADVDASLLYFCSIVSQSNKVVLTGECADEIFGGYPWFYRPDLTQGEGFPWSKNMDVRRCLLKDGFAASLDLDDYADDTYRTSVAQMPVLRGEDPSDQKQRKITYLNIKWFMQTLLDRMDRTSMHCGLEARVPLADHRIIDYVFNVPWKMKYQNGVEKSLLREAFRGQLPNAVLFRKKSPYPKTYNPQYEAILGEKLQSILKNPDSPLGLICDAKKVEKFIQAPSEYGKPWFGQLMAGPQLLAYFIQLDDWFSLYHPEISL